MIKYYIILLILLSPFWSCTNSNRVKENIPPKIECIFIYLPNCVISEAKLVSFISLKDKLKDTNINFTLYYLNELSEDSPNFNYQLKNKKLEGITILKNMLKYVHSINVETVPIIIIKSNNNIVYKGAFDNEYIDLNKKQKRFQSIM